MTKAPDKFEAARAVVDTLKDFDPTEQEMIFRWAAESLGLPQPFGASGATKPPSHVAGTVPPPGPPSQAAPPTPGSSPQDIKSFVAAKSPRSDVQFAATVAYYYQFVAPPSVKKTAITKEDLVDAFRKVGGRKIPPHPEMTLNNAYLAGLLDRAEKGAYGINSVGENLVTMTLPDGGSTPNKKKKTAKKRSSKSGKGTRKKATNKAKA